MAGIQIDGVNNKIDFDDDADTSISSATDDTLVVEVGGNTLATVTATSVTVNDGVEITTADNTDTLTLTSTDADASSGPNIVLNRDSGSPADNDIVGQFTFRADNDAGEATDYCRFRSHLADVSDGTEDGIFRLFTLSGGAELSRIAVEGGETVFNENAADINFRIESDTNDNIFFVDAGRNEVVVGTSNDMSALFAVNQEQTDHRSLQVEANTSSFASDVMDIGCTRNTNDTSYRFLTMQRRGFIQVFRVTDAGDVDNVNNSYGALSDQRLKTDITDSGSQWDDIKAIKVKKFKMGFGGDETTKLGVIAQDVEDAGMNGLVKQRDANEYEIKYNPVFGSLYEDGDDIPEGKKVGEIKENKEKVKEVKYSILYMKAIKALQEAQTRIETLETKVAALEGN